MRVYPTFSIRAWSALSTGLLEKDQWLIWAKRPWVPAGWEGDVPLVDIPAMARRRLSVLGKMAISVADQVLVQLVRDKNEVPVVWASRYGDAHRSLELLGHQAAQEALSPTSFGLSVHNGIAAQHSIAREVHANALCISAGANTPQAGVIEALALLAEGASEVLLVCYDAPLPGRYAQFQDGPSCAYAWAWLLAKNQSEQVATQQQMPCMALTASTSDAECADSPSLLSDLPSGLVPMYYMLSGQSGGDSFWRWEHVRD